MLISLVGARQRRKTVAVPMLRFWDTAVARGNARFCRTSLVRSIVCSAFSLSVFDAWYSRQNRSSVVRPLTVYLYYYITYITFLKTKT